MRLRRQTRDGRLDEEAQAATGGGEDGAGAMSAAGLATTAATVTLRRVWAAQGVGMPQKSVETGRPATPLRVATFTLSPGTGPQAFGSSAARANPAALNQNTLE